MNGWKKNLPWILFAFASVVSLLAAMAGPVLDGEPPNYNQLIVGGALFVFAVVFFVVGRKFAGVSGPPSA